MSVPDTDEARVQTLLGQAGRRAEPPMGRQQEWEAVFRRELAPVVHARRQQRRFRAGAAAAVMVLAAGAFLLLDSPVQPPVIVAHVLSAVDGNQSYADGATIGRLSRGSSVQVGQTIRTAPGGTLALTYREADVRLNHDTTVRFHAARIELVEGSIYVDTGQDRARGPLPVIVTTPQGSFSHVGTPFMVMVDATRNVTAAVREGTIMLRADDIQRDFSADDDGPRVVRISPSGNVETEHTDGHGGLWTWVVSSSPGKAIDGHSADEVLSWISREMGLRLTYADERSARAASKPMHAPSEPVSPDQALEWVRDTTSLTVDTSNVELFVSTSQ